MILFSSHRTLADLDGTGSSGESWQASLESRNLAPGSAAASVDPSHAELVLYPLLQSGYLLVVDVGIGDENVCQLGVLAYSAVANPVAFQWTVGLQWGLPFKVHCDLVVCVHQSDNCP